MFFESEVCSTCKVGKERRQFSFRQGEEAAAKDRFCLPCTPSLEAPKVQKFRQCCDCKEKKDVCEFTPTSLGRSLEKSRCKKCCNAYEAAQMRLKTHRTCSSCSVEKIERGVFSETADGL